MDAHETAQVEERLRSAFARYTTANLAGITPAAFKEWLRARIGRVDPDSEGYHRYELERQRDLSVKFHWGHDHDFGTLYLKGLMGERHVTVLADFIQLFHLDLRWLSGKAVLDVGCWTGGTTLMLAALGASVTAVEEVKKYADTAAFLVSSFGLDQQVSVVATSLYSLDLRLFAGRYDVVHCPGVIYHLSDPVLALRIMFNCLKPDGMVLLESQGFDSPQPVCSFPGIDCHAAGSKADLSRITWNWFVPSGPALRRMMAAAGFGGIKIAWARGRLYAYGTKTTQVGICKAGLSRPDIP